jgi:hypothetical protein
VRTLLRRAVLLLGTTAAFAAGAQELRYFYCYVPDPASGTVFMSPAMPVGPLAERSGYGVEFAAHLQRTGKVHERRQGYCAMRPSLEAIARAQAALPQESCVECAGATRFEGVAWQRNGVDAPAPRATAVANRKGRPVATATTDATSPPPERYLLVMGNSRTGKLLALGNRPTREAAEATAARFPAATGWKTLLLTSEPGFGAAVCAREAGETRFFVAHAQDSLQEAVQMARDYALQNAVDHAAIELCGSPWQAGPGIEAPQSVGDAIIDTIKQWVRGQVVCDPTVETCPDRPKSRPSAIGVRG